MQTAKCRKKGPFAAVPFEESMKKKVYINTRCWVLENVCFLFTTITIKKKYVHFVFKK